MSTARNPTHPNPKRTTRQDKQTRNTVPNGLREECALRKPSSAHVPNQNNFFFRRKWQSWHLSHTGCTPKRVRCALIPHTMCMTHAAPTLHVIAEQGVVLKVRTKDMRFHFFGARQSRRQDKESNTSRFEHQPLQVEETAVY